MAGPVVRVLGIMNSTLGIEEVVNVGTCAGLVNYALEVLLVTVQSESFRIPVHSTVMGILFGEVVLVMLDCVPRLVANQNLDEPVVEFDLSN